MQQPPEKLTVKVSNAMSFYAYEDREEVAIPLNLMIGESTLTLSPIDKLIYLQLIIMTAGKHIEEIDVFTGYLAGVLNTSAEQVTKSLDQLKERHLIKINALKLKLEITK